VSSRDLIRQFYLFGLNAAEKRQQGISFPSTTVNGNEMEELQSPASLLYRPVIPGITRDVGFDSRRSPLPLTAVRLDPFPTESELGLVALKG
jgi:hypothetical protein